MRRIRLGRPITSETIRCGPKAGPRLPKPGKPATYAEGYFCCDGEDCYTIVRIQCYGKAYDRFYDFCLPTADDPKIKVHASDVRTAAEKAVEKYDCAGASEMTNAVRCMVLAPDGKRTYVTVTRELVPQYYAEAAR